MSALECNDISHFRSPSTSKGADLGLNRGTTSSYVFDSTCSYGGSAC